MIWRLESAERSFLRHPGLIGILVVRDRHLHHLLPTLLAPSIRGTFG
jgi:hypothetical protein